MTMKKLRSLDFVVCFTTLLVVYCIDFVLLKDNFLQNSLLSIIDNSHYFHPPFKHVLIHALIPLYIAVVTFSACIFGAALGFFLHYFFFVEKGPNNDLRN
jgi:hypothetical protein